MKRKEFLTNNLVVAPEYAEILNERPAYYLERHKKLLEDFKVITFEEYCQYYG